MSPGKILNRTGNDNVGIQVANVRDFQLHAFGESTAAPRAEKPFQCRPDIINNVVMIEARTGHSVNLAIVILMADFALFFQLEVLFDSHPPVN
ncbi:hypothetical protein D3C87_1736370 [compost metagenome]